METKDALDVIHEMSPTDHRCFLAYLSGRLGPELWTQYFEEWNPANYIR